MASVIGSESHSRRTQKSRTAFGASNEDTEKAYVDWIRRYILFHQKKHPSTMGATELVAFLSWLAVDKQVSASIATRSWSGVAKDGRIG